MVGEFKLAEVCDEEMLSFRQLTVFVDFEYAATRGIDCIPAVGPWCDLHLQKHELPQLALLLCFLAEADKDCVLLGERLEGVLLCLLGSGLGYEKTP